MKVQGKSLTAIVQEDGVTYRVILEQQEDGLYKEVRSEWIHPSRNDHAPLSMDSTRN